jgi:UDP-perosamine 4-acetyltransferase
MNRPVIVLGAGGHAKVLIDMLRARGAVVLGITDAAPELCAPAVLGVPVIGDDSRIGHYGQQDVLLVNGLGSTGLPERRTALFETFTAAGYTFATVSHPAAVIAGDAVLGEGAQVMAGAVIQPGVRLGRNCIVNTQATVDHDCVIGDHVHLAPGATLCGAVTVGAGSHVGTGAIVVQGVAVGSRCLIAAGAVVIAALPDGASARGVPARQHLRGDGC